MTASLRCTWILVCAFTVGLVLTCGGDSQETGPAAEAPALPSATPPAADPAWSGSLPANFPSDVPQYPGAQITAARTSADQGIAVSLTVEDDVETVASFYADSFAAEGWSTDIRESPVGRAIFADKGKRSASAMVRSGEKGTLVDLIVVQMN